MTATKTKTKTKALAAGEIAALMGCKPKSAVSRLVALGYTESCGRCGGSGRYSWNQIDGDRCFGCGGVGKRLAKITAAVVTEALARIAAGELAGYFAENAARKELGAAHKALWDAYMATVGGKDYTAWDLASRREAQARAMAGLEPYPADHLETPVYRMQTLKNKIMDRASDAFYAKKSTHLERIAVIREALAMVLEIDRAWVASKGGAS